MNDKKMQTDKGERKTMYYEEYGNKDGRVVLFIHGGFTTSESFQKQKERLPEYHCIFVDLPGYGKSIMDKRYQFDYVDSAQKLMDLIQKLSPEKKVIIVGHSYGGLVVKQLLERIPEKIERVVIGSTNIKKSLLYWIYTRKLGCLIVWLMNRERLKKENIDWRRVCQTQKTAWRNFRIPVKEKIKDIPALLLYAQYDIEDIKESMKLWQQCLPIAKLCQVENSGHNYFWDCPEQVNLLLKEFLA